MKDSKGFTLIEVLIVAIIGAIIAGALIYVLGGSRRAARLAELESQAQQNARVAVDYVTRDLRSLGYGVDYGGGQRAIVYAGPYDLIFNANIDPEPDDASSPGSPSAMNVSSSPATVPPSGTVKYSPAGTFATGAETIRFTFDSTDDGVIDANDRADEPIETSTANPRDYSLIKQVYGYNGTDNGGANQAFALLRGPEQWGNGDSPEPLFTYWYNHDDDESTPDVLWGDASGNGRLEQSEIATLGPVTAGNLVRIGSIGVHAIGTTPAPDVRYTPDPDSAADEGYRATVITSEISVRNIPTRASYITGVAFNDINSNGAYDLGEAGITGAIVRLNTGAVRVTDSQGSYSFRVDAGTYTVSETKLAGAGYTPTTPTSVPVTVAIGQVSSANFGYRATAGYGSILGKVTLDENADGLLDPDEPGVEGVQVFLDTGERDTTEANGAYMFLVAVSTYNVTMAVPSGYLAVGPATANVTLDADGDSARVDFGLVVATETGTIAGKVYEDDDNDGVLDTGEAGIAGVKIKLDSGDSTLTDAAGLYSFTVTPGVYDVAEEDLLGYESTTINNVTDVVVQTDSTVIVNFGDRLASSLAFTVITLGETQRALCIISADLKEDNRGDKDILLGTKYVSGVSNLNVWWNQWQSRSTPNASIFDQNPSYSRTPSEDIFSMDSGDLNGDGTSDVITGLTATTARVLVWITQTGGNNKGKLPTSPTSFFTVSDNGSVLAAKLKNVDSDTDLDAVVGTEWFPYRGKFEVWFNGGTGTFSHGADDIYSMAGTRALGAVRSIAVADLAGSAAIDVVLGTATGLGAGRVEIFRDNGAPTGKYTFHRSLNVNGEANAVVVRDMLEDSNGDEDIIVGTATAFGAGTVQIWHNNGDGTFGTLNLNGTYGPSDSVSMAGEVLCLGVERFDRDIYPDIAVGIRTFSYSGFLKIYPCFGFMPSSGSEYTSPNLGEVITITINDFNDPNVSVYDLAVGTRTSLNQGRVVVFFNDVQ